MRWAGYRELPLKRLKLPGDIPARMKLPHVIELSKSIDLGNELINAPVVEGETEELHAGRDRIAACLLRRMKKVWCHVAVEMTDEDRADLELFENLHRRQDNRDELIARRVARLAGQLPDTASGKPGRRKTARGAAREQVAREIGTTPEAVRAAEKRAEADEQEEQEEPATPVVVPPPVETWGVPVDHLAQEFASVRIAQEAMRAADRHLQAAQRALAALADGGGVARHYHARLYAGVHNAAAALRADIPTALCPYCKGAPQRQVNCNGCSRIGYVGDNALLGVAEELKRGGAAACVPDGKGGFMPAVVTPAKKKAIPSAAKALQILDADDKPIVVPPDEDLF